MMTTDSGHMQNIFFLPRMVSLNKHYHYILYMCDSELQLSTGTIYAIVYSLFPKPESPNLLHHWNIMSKHITSKPVQRAET